ADGGVVAEVVGLGAVEVVAHEVGDEIRAGRPRRHARDRRRTVERRLDGDAAFVESERGERRAALRLRRLIERREQRRIARSRRRTGRLTELRVAVAAAAIRTFFVVADPADEFL